MRVVLAGDRAVIEGLVTALDEEGVEALLPGPGTAQAEGSVAGAMAGSLVAIEVLVTSRRPDAVVVSGAGEEALAAVLVGTKLLLPVAAAPGVAPDEDHDASNRRLIVRLADASLAAEPAPIAAWIRERTSTGPAYGAG